MAYNSLFLICAHFNFQRTLYRQFLRRANGSVIEMFGSSELSLAAADSYKELDTMLREAAQRDGGDDVER